MMVRHTHAIQGDRKYLIVIFFCRLKNLYSNKDKQCQDILKIYLINTQSNNLIKILLKIIHLFDCKLIQSNPSSFRILYNQYLMRYQNVVPSVIINLLALISLYFLSHILITENQYIAETSKIRFTCFIFLHFFLIAMLVALLMIRQTYSYAKWILLLSSVFVTSMTLVQIHLYRRRGHHLTIVLKPILPLELAYINCYFLVYIYSVIGMIFSGMFIALTNCCILWHVKKIKSAIKQSIRQIQYNHTQMNEKDCSICLSPLMGISKYFKLLEIKCGHIFHEDCILEWIRINQVCPVCRYCVFKSLENQQVELRVRRQI